MDRRRRLPPRKDRDYAACRYHQGRRPAAALSACWKRLHFRQKILALAIWSLASSIVTYSLNGGGSPRPASAFGVATRAFRTPTQDTAAGLYFFTDRRHPFLSVSIIGGVRSVVLVSQRPTPALAVLLVLAWAAAPPCYSASGIHPSEVPLISSTASSSPDIVIGFVGGFVRHDDPHHGPVKLAQRLRETYPAGVAIETFENRHRKSAYRAIVRLLDSNHDGALSDGERRNARIVLFGHSWGASAAVALARDLQRQNI